MDMCKVWRAGEPLAAFPIIMLVNTHIFIRYSPQLFMLPGAVHCLAHSFTCHNIIDHLPWNITDQYAHRLAANALIIIHNIYSLKEAVAFLFTNRRKCTHFSELSIASKFTAIIDRPLSAHIVLFRSLHFMQYRHPHRPIWYLPTWSAIWCLVDSLLQV